MQTPPHSLEAEQSVIGGLLLDPEAWFRIEGLVVPEDFYRYDHQQVFAAVSGLARENQPIDIVTVSERLADKLEEVGGHGFLASLLNNTPTTANIEHYAKTVADHARKRRVISTLNEQLAEAYQPGSTANDLIDSTSNALSMIESTGDAGYIDRETGLRGFVDELDYVWQLHQNGELPGIPTGIERYDRKFGGLHRGDLVVLAARPSMGKSSLVQSWQLNQGKFGYTTAIHSLEMPDKQLNQRWMAMLSGVPAENIKRGALSDDDWPRLVQAQGRLAKLPIHSYDKPVTASQIARQARRLQKDSGLDVLYVDYLLLVTPEDGDSREQQVSSMSRAFKRIAMELDIPVVLLTQLNRSCEKREDKRPMLSDLRDSGAVEQDADVVMFLYRDGMYHEQTPKSEAELIVRKNRQGDTGVGRLRFLEQTTMFADAEDRYREDAA